MNECCWCSQLAMWKVIGKLVPTNTDLVCESHIDMYLDPLDVWNWDIERLYPSKTQEIL